LAATSVPVGDGHENVLTEKRVRKPQQNAGGGFTRRPSTNNLKSFASSGNLQASYNHNGGSNNNMNNAHAHHMISTAAAAPTHTGTPTPANSYHSMTKMNTKGTESNAKEDEGCDLTATC
jgi:hypothetical protein